MYLKTINPANGEIVREFEEYNWDVVDTILENNALAYTTWRKTSVTYRADLLLKLAGVLRNHAEGLAFNITLEMGKCIREALSEIEKCATLCEYYASNANVILQKEVVETNASLSYITFQPLGSILAIMPWNFPFWQVFRFAIPTLLGGNTCVLKHATNVPACSLAIEEMFLEAGFPPYVFSSLLVRNRKVENIISDKRIKAIAFTGSTEVGKTVAAFAGKQLKKCVLELGGSDPYLILDDADIDAAVSACVAGRIVNAGQSCIGAKRFIVVEAVYDAFEKAFTSSMQNITMGDPFDESIQMGPLARFNLREDLHMQVENSLSKGAKLLTGGVIPDDAGAYYPPTVLANVGPGMAAYHEELFGPVAALIRVKDEAEAIRVANDTTFGLGAAVFTADIQRGQRIAEFELEAGACFVNDFVRSDPRLPFGGINDSGYGRELSHYGIKEFVNIKTVYIK